MKMQNTKLTSKNQTSVPKEVRDILGVKKGEDVQWHIIKGMVIVVKTKKIKNPVKFLTSQIKLDLDAVKLVRETREEFG